MDIFAVVMRLTGPVEPVGDSCIDSTRLENLKALCDLTGLLLDRITSVAEATDGHMASVKAAKDHAAAFLAASVMEMEEKREQDAEWLATQSTDGVALPQTGQDGFMEAFYEMAEMLGVKGAQAKSPEQVYHEQVKPALEALKQRAASAEDAYVNMRSWAEASGLDTTARNAGVTGTFNTEEKNHG
jgi:hypothetical protein